jgi:glycosyltransferase involved in cell wall biosynthesis
MNIMTDWRGRTNVRRIQIFVSDLSATGVVRNAIAIANEAAASGYQVRLLTCNADGVLRSELGRGVALVRLNDPSDSHHPRRTQMKRALLAYRKHCREWRPDIMLSAGNHGHLLSTFAWLGLPGMKVLRFSNDLTHGTPSRLTRLWRSARFRLMAWAADRLVYVSRAQARHPLLARQLASGKALVIPNGVDLELVARSATQPCNHPWLDDASIPVVLAVGRHVSQKNFAALLKAFAVARVARPMRLIFLGDGKPTAIKALRDLAAELGVGSDVDFVPATENPFTFMATARTLVLPSLWEGSANVLLEAMACDTPAIASRTAGDAEDVLDNGRYGVLVDPRDIGQMAEALLRQTGPNPIRAGTRALAFSRSDTMRQYIRLIDQLGAQPIGRSVSRAAPVRA